MSTAPHARTVRRLLLVTLAMFGFGFAMVPIYDVFCDVTGLNGKTNSRADAQAAAVDKVADRLVTVEFIASVNGGLPWEFRPVTHKLRVHPGESVTTHYLARNRGAADTLGQAVPSVAPGKAATHFRKVECFCFTQQALAGGESREMPVTFVVDPDLPPEVSTVTLSYTFYPHPDSPAAEQLASGPGDLEGIGHDHHAHH